MFSFAVLAANKDAEKDNKRHTMSHPPEHIPELEGHISRSPIHKEKKDKVSIHIIYS